MLRATLSLALVLAAGPALAASARRVADLLPGPGGGVLQPFHATEVAGQLVFSAHDAAAAPYYLWQYDGANPPALVAGQVPAGSQPQHFAFWQGNLHYSTNASGGIWRYDGANSPVQVAAAINVGFPHSLTPFVAPPAVDLLCFVGYAAGSSSELLCLDGAGEIELYDIAPGSAASLPGDLRQLAGELHFAATSAAGDRELWRFDGANPPVLVADLRTNGSSDPQDLVVAQGALFFTALDEAGARRLWRYDGLGAPEPVSPSFLIASGDLGVYRGDVYAFGRDDVAGTPNRLWRYDGAELVELADAGPQMYNLASPAVDDDLLYFLAGCGCSGADLWVYCGESAPVVATHEFDDLDLVSGGPLAAIGRVFFVAHADELGAELWEVDLAAPLCDDFETGDTSDWSSVEP